MMNEQDYSTAVRNMRNRTSRLEREGDCWEQYEKDQLVWMFNEGVGIPEIAVQLQRTEPAVYQQIEKLDLYQRKENPQRRKNPVQPSDCLCSLCKRPRSMCPLCGVYANRQEDA